MCKTFQEEGAICDVLVLYMHDTYIMYMSGQRTHNINVGNNEWCGHTQVSSVDPGAPLKKSSLKQHSPKLHHAFHHSFRHSCTSLLLPLLDHINTPTPVSL
eukprot:scpid109173/ scgid15478/ 